MSSGPSKLGSSSGAPTHSNFQVLNTVCPGSRVQERTRQPCRSRSRRLTRESREVGSVNRRPVARVLSSVPSSQSFQSKLANKAQVSPQDNNACHPLYSSRLDASIQPTRSFAVTKGKIPLYDLRKSLDGRPEPAKTPGWGMVYVTLVCGLCLTSSWEKTCRRIP